MILLKYVKKFIKSQIEEEAQKAGFKKADSCYNQVWEK